MMQQPQNILTCFEKTVLQHGSKTAIFVDNKTFSFSDINAIANKIARYLLDISGENQRFNTDTTIAICMQPSEWTLLSILGILKAGAAYVPIDPAYPEQRIEYIINDSACDFVLSDTENALKLKTKYASQDITCLDVSSIDLDSFQHSNLNVDRYDNELAYLLYTSGTTGLPKGVMIEHLSVVNYSHNVAKYLLVNSQHRIDFSTSIGFDLSVTTTITALLLGSCVVVYQGSHKNLQSYSQHLIDHQVTTVKVTPSYAELLLTIIADTAIHTLILGGEKLSNTLTQKLHALSPMLKIYNEYGPTETTVGATIRLVQTDDINNIGHIYDGMSAYILNEQQQPVSKGDIGELYLSGVGVARGYQNLPARKSDPFIAAMKINHKQVEKLYKTGDLVSQYNDGSMAYHGRIDEQIKLYGYRIEPAEIKAALLAIPDIIHAHVLLRSLTIGKKKSHSLVAYYSMNNQQNSLNKQTLRSHLKRTLPDYMIPAQFIVLEQLPLTINGKVDVKTLEKLK
jgi:amino acid adenylation domain-containing protein